MEVPTPDNPPPAYTPTPATDAPQFKLAKDYKKWLLDNTWPEYYWHVKEPEDAETTVKKKEWLKESDHTKRLQAHFNFVIPLGLHVYKFFTNNARQTRQGKKNKPKKPTNPATTTNQTTPPPATAPAAASGPAVADATPAANRPSINPPVDSAPPVAELSTGASTSKSNVKQRAVSTRTVVEAKYKDLIMSTAETAAAGQGGGRWMAAYQAAITEQMAKLMEEEREECEKDAKALNECRAVKPEPEHILKNQNVLPQMAASVLKEFIGNNWGQAGEVAFVVHTIQPHVITGEPVIHMMTVSGSNATRKAFTIHDNDYKTFEDVFIEPARQWFKEVMQGKGKWRGKARAKVKPKAEPKMEATPDFTLETANNIPPPSSDSFELPTVNAKPADCVNLTASSNSNDRTANKTPPPLPSNTDHEIIVDAMQSEPAAPSTIPHPIPVDSNDRTSVGMLMTLYFPPLLCLPLHGHKDIEGGQDAYVTGSTSNKTGLEGAQLKEHRPEQVQGVTPANSEYAQSQLSGSLTPLAPSVSNSPRSLPNSDPATVTPEAPATPKTAGAGEGSKEAVDEATTGKKRKRGGGGPAKKRKVQNEFAAGNNASCRVTCSKAKDPK
ncbi:hypothetical protein PQX77_022125 [Marasmius sp. AFHP31]|nr:hypothetical protein PQX77_022125 [Marasmius sp. AFHP31]